MEDKYDLYSIEKELIEELEDNKEEILNDKWDNLHEYVDSNISVYTYDQIMIYANNSDLWHMSSGLGGETAKDLLNIFKYTFAGMVFMAILVTVLILFFPYYLGKEFIQFFNNKKGETND